MGDFKEEMLWVLVCSGFQDAWHVSMLVGVDVVA